MSIIPATDKVFMVNNKTNTIYGGSAALQAMNEWYTMQDVIETVSTSQGEEVSYTVAGGTSGTQPVFSGPPLFSGSYIKIGKLVHFQIQVDMDNITNFGTGQYFVTLPFKVAHGYMFRDGCLHDISTSREYHISGHAYTDSNIMQLFTSDTQGNTLYDFPFTSTEPIILNVADNFHVSGTYITNE